MFKSSAIWRASAAVGIIGSIMLAFGGMSMASTMATGTVPPTGPKAGPSFDVESLATPGQDGLITIVTTSTTTGTATWTFSGLAIGDTISVYAFPKGFPSDITPLTVSSDTVSSAGTFSATVTLPTGDTWSNTGIEMEVSNFATGETPEVPWAAGLPLLLILPLGLSVLRRRTSV